MSRSVKCTIFCVLVYANLFAVEGCQGGTRKKRSGPSEVPMAPEVDMTLSDFFTTCLQPIASILFPSTRSVVDYTIRDTWWYDKVDTTICSGVDDTYECWTALLIFLFDIDSVLLEPTKQCICEWDSNCPDNSRKKREAKPCVNVTESHVYEVNQQKFLLSEPDLAFSNCIDEALLLESTADYPSLENFDAESNSLFLVGHYSYCNPDLINSFNFEDVDTYIVNTLPTSCSKTGEGSSWRNNLVDTLSVVTRDNSPIYQPFLSCEAKLQSDGVETFVGKGECTDEYAGCVKSVKCRVHRIYYDKCRKTCGACE